MCVPHVNTVSQMQTHETKGVLHRHIFSACWAEGNKAFGHSQVDCRHTRLKMDMVHNVRGHAQNTRLFVNKSVK